MASPKVTMEEAIVIPTGEYRMLVMDYEEVQGQFGQQYKFKLEMPQGSDYAGKYLSLWTPTNLTPKNKFGRFIQAAGFDMELGMELMLDDLLQRPVTAVVIVTTGKDGTEFSKVEAVKRPKVRTPQAKAATAATARPRPVPVDVDADGDPFSDE